MSPKRLPVETARINLWASPEKKLRYQRAATAKA